MNPIIETLRAAKERLFEKGWKQGGLGFEDGPNCLVGAIIKVNQFNVQELAFNYNRWANTVVPAVMAIASSLNDDPYYSAVAFFNDNESTTFDNIVDLIDKTIKNLEG